MMFFSLFAKELSVAGSNLPHELRFKDIRRPHIWHGALANVLRGRSLASTLVRPKAFHCACSRIPFPNLTSCHRAVHGQAVRLAVQRSPEFLWRFRSAVRSELELQIPMRLPDNAPTATNITTVTPKTSLSLRARKGLGRSAASINGMRIDIL